MSNFNERHLEALLEDPTITHPPRVNQVCVRSVFGCRTKARTEEIASPPTHTTQVEVHPFFPQRSLRAYCQARGILVQAYSSLGQGDVGLQGHPAVAAAAARRGMTPAQVLLRYGYAGSSVESFLSCLACLSARIHWPRPFESLIGLSRPPSFFRWALDQGMPVLPKTTRPPRMAENMAALTACPPLEPEDTAALDALDRGPGGKLAWDPEPVV